VRNVEALKRRFYARNTLIVAKQLLGKLLVRELHDGMLVGKIVEVEAYRGSDDPASHAHKSKTPRNAIMFGKAGHAYVYFIYGKHYCLNATTERRGVPGAVLIRALEPINGIEMMQKNRRTKSLIALTSGPGKLTHAMEITKKLNGWDLTKGEKLSICKPKKKEEFEIASTRRVGIKAGSEKPWRFYIKGNKFVSISLMTPINPRNSRKTHA
jgi:DNA-3-methyladenine glycosylase